LRIRSKRQIGLAANDNGNIRRLNRRNTAQGRENEENHSSCKIAARWRHAGTGAAQEVTSDEFDLGAWITQFRDAKAGAAVLSLVGTLDKPYDLLLGRKTYDIFAGHWPRVPADDPIGPVFTKRTNMY
jgi:hypothetical protein